MYYCEVKVKWCYSVITLVAVELMKKYVEVTLNLSKCKRNVTVKLDLWWGYRKLTAKW